jgi:hypothetical protein
MYSVPILSHHAKTGKGRDVYRKEWVSTVFETSYDPNVTEEQMNRCHRIEGSDGVFYLVESESDPLTEYKVDSLKINGKRYYTCSCPAGQQAAAVNMLTGPGLMQSGSRLSKPRSTSRLSSAYRTAERWCTRSSKALTATT